MKVDFLLLCPKTANENHPWSIHIHRRVRFSSILDDFLYTSMKSVLYIEFFTDLYVLCAKFNQPFSAFGRKTAAGYRDGFSQIFRLGMKDIALQKSLYPRRILTNHLYTRAGSG